MNLENNFLQSKKLIQDRVLNMINNADYVNFLFEQPIEEEARNLLNRVKDDYEATKNILMDLEDYINNKRDCDLYIIDSNNVVVTTTASEDLGLDFSEWPHFTAFLDEVREGGVFASSRVSLSLIEEDLTKFCYMPSSDGKYIFEMGSVIENQNGYLANVEFDNFEKQILEESSFVDSIVLYDYQGIAYKKDENGTNIKISEANRPYFEKALITMDSVKNSGINNDKTAYYEYIPYEIMGARGANERNVVEIIFNDQELQDSLNRNLVFIIITVLSAAIIAAWIGSYMAGRITAPIEELTAGVKEVANGNLTYEFTLHNNDEFSILGKQFNAMLHEIRRLLGERNQYVYDLTIKNTEIFNQKEEITALYEETTALNEELEGVLAQNMNSYFETVRALANAIDEKDSYTGGHCERVMDYSRMIAEELGVSEKELDDLKFGSVLHDIGKIGISEYILNKDTKLTPEEFEEIKKHPEKGGHILRDLNFLHNCRRIINEHHERMDGKGYPKGLVGDEIYFLAKIVCVADSYDAMTSSRPYRKSALTREQAKEELIKNKGTQFDERVVDAFLKCLCLEDIPFVNTRGQKIQ
jgi:putative nucleotidyltransferase with HDIG domain